MGRDPKLPKSMAKRYLFRVDPLFMTNAEE
jgi:hypothetical protein